MYMHYRVNNIAIVETPKFATFLWICKIDMSVLEDTTHTYTSNMKVCTSGSCISPGSMDMFSTIFFIGQSENNSTENVPIQQEDLSVKRLAAPSAEPQHNTSKSGKHNLQLDVYNNGE